MDQYRLFDELFDELAVQDSIQNLFSGEIVNVTESRPASHHQYRAHKPSPDFDFKKICDPLLQQIKKGKYKNIITFGIGGSYEGPKFLQEFLLTPSSDTKYFFVSGQNKDEFNSIYKPFY